MADTVLLSFIREKVDKLACLAGSCALVMEKVIQQFIVRSGNNVDVIIAH